MIIKDADGKDMEVFTAAELAEKETAAATAAVETYKAENPDKSGELTELQQKLADAEAKVAAAENDPQKARLIQERDEAKTALTTALEPIKKELENIKTAGVVEYKDELVKALVGADEELKKKVLFEFDRYRPQDITKEAIKERLETAYTLVQGQKPQPGALDNLNGLGAQRGAGHSGYSNAPVQDNPNRAAMRSILGITDEDVKNFGPKK